MTGAGELSRREFIGHSSAVAIAAAIPIWRQSQPDCAHHPLTLSLLGLGARGRSWLPRLRAAGVHLHSIADPDGEALKLGMRTAISHGFLPTNSGRDEDILTDPTVRAVLVAAPHETAPSLAIAACLRGKDVYLDQPSCGDPEALEALLRAAELHRRGIQLGLIGLSDHVARASLATVLDGSVGRVRGARVTVFVNGAPQVALPDGVVNEVAIALEALRVRRVTEFRHTKYALRGPVSRTWWCRFAEGPALEVVMQRSTREAESHTISVEFLGDRGRLAVAARGFDAIARYGADAAERHLGNFVDFLRGTRSDLAAELRQTALADLLVRAISDELAVHG